MDLRTARAERSRARLKAAFLELFAAKEPEDITVVELCRSSGLNRSTFYAHYSFMEELTAEVLRESVIEVFAGITTQWELPMEQDGGVERGFIAEYVERLLGNRTVRRFCTCANAANYRTQIIRAHVDLTLGPSRDSPAYFAAFFQNAGALSFLLEWFNSGSSVPIGTMVDIIHEFSKVMYRPWPPSPPAE